MSCGIDPEDTAVEEDECSRHPPLTYDNFGKGYMELHCVGCHSSLYPEYLRSGAPVGVDFNTYRDVIDWLERIEVRATGDEPDMPPAGGPSADEIALFEEWLKCEVWPDRQALEDQGKL